MKWRVRTLGSVMVLLSAACCSSAQTAMDVSRLEQIPAVSGYEQQLIDEIRTQLRGLSPKTDNLGNLWISFGSGSPHRLLVTPVDEPGYVVSDITPDGFLRVQRLPQAAPNPVFDTLHFAQPIWVMTRSGKKVPGVFAGLSVHLQPARVNPPKMNHPDEMYVDIGATSTADVRAAGVELLDPIALQRKWFPVGPSGEAGPATGDRFGCAALLQLLEHIKDSKAKGTTTIAFVTQQWAGGRGLNRLLEEIKPDEMIFVGRISSGGKNAGATKVTPVPGDGVLLGVEDVSAPLKALSAEIKAIADGDGERLTTVSASPLRMAGYAIPNAFPERFSQLGIPTLWPVTSGEFISWNDRGNLERLLEAYLQIPKSMVGHGGGSGGGSEISAFQALVEAYGASGHEENVRKVVLNRLDPRLQRQVQTDPAGNLSLHLGVVDRKARHIAFVAHMDEIGYEVKKIEDDGRLLVSVLGGGYPEYFLGHIVLIHKTDSTSTGGVLELPTGWDQSGFEWPHGPRSLDESVHVYVGTRSTEETQKLGIKVGDWITIPKEYHPLLGRRANARGFDDRVGCAALVEAVNALGSDLPGRDVTFIWSTEEEVGLKGAAAAAERMAKEGRTPDFVFAIDTFVSSDSPLESKRFADAEIGKGFVIRAVDNSNITPREYVDRVIKLARENGIPVQFGVTGGGNDGAVFTGYGSVNVPLGWPLRYSHSPGEVIDTRDLDALSKIITVLAKSWQPLAPAPHP
ncbi:MAG TPA: M20/M25/M40 family metallo-hydrolase [Candidatus Acidoferrum sp.]|nr:M20/M25/M40 family metallo-hydrolase [Candidatus Acidoferrum sp.]